MSYQNLGGPDVQASRLAQIGAIIGPVIPYFVYRNRRDEEPVSARDAAAATNFGMFVLAAFVAGTVVRLWVPWVGWLGAIVQVSILVIAVVLCTQALNSVTRGVPAEYPLGVPVIRV